jgi:hypothetical protein
MTLGYWESGKPLPGAGLCLYARLELLLIVALYIPNIFAFFIFPLVPKYFSERVLLWGYPGIFETIKYFCYSFVIAIGFVLALGVVFDRFRGLKGPHAVELPAQTRAQLCSEVNASCGRRFDRFLSSRLTVVPSDLSLGAHVRGVFSQWIVISGGMLAGLLSRDARAVCIIAHEVGHIRNLDKLLPGVLLLMLLSMVSALAFYRNLYALIVIVTLYALTSHFCRRREFAADAFAISALGSSNAFLDTMSGTKEYNRTFFHPSKSERVVAVERDLPILKFSPFWCVTWLAVIMVAIYGYWNVFAEKKFDCKPSRYVPLPLETQQAWCTLFANDPFPDVKPEYWALMAIQVTIAALGIIFELSKISQIQLLLGIGNQAKIVGKPATRFATVSQENYSKLTMPVLALAGAIGSIPAFSLLFVWLSNRIEGGLDWQRVLFFVGAGVGCGILSGIFRTRLGVAMSVTIATVAAIIIYLLHEFATVSDYKGAVVLSIFDFFFCIFLLAPSLALTLMLLEMFAPRGPWKYRR